MLDEYKLVKRIIVTLEDKTTELLDDRATKMSTSRNYLIKQIVRKHLGLPNILEEGRTETLEEKLEREGDEKYREEHDLNFDGSPIVYPGEEKKGDSDG